MAFFKFLGELPDAAVDVMGQTHEISVPKQDGTFTVLVCSEPEGWQVDEELPFDFTDPRSLTAMRVDPRFEEI